MNSAFSGKKKGNRKQNAPVFKYAQCESTQTHSLIHIISSPLFMDLFLHRIAAVSMCSVVVVFIIFFFLSFSRSLISTQQTRRTDNLPSTGNREIKKGNVVINRHSLLVSVYMYTYYFLFSYCFWTTLLLFWILCTRQKDKSTQIIRWRRKRKKNLTNKQSYLYFKNLQIIFHKEESDKSDALIRTIQLH